MMKNNPTKKLLVLSQIGSPEFPTASSVGTYLKKFLMDPRIITAPGIVRWLLVNGLIVPRRKYQSAKKYQKIWTEQGSTLVVETVKFKKALELELDSNEWDVIIHWRYGQSTDQQFADIDKKSYSEIYLAPLYPQYAAATTESALDVLIPYFRKKFSNADLFKLNPFYQTPEWIDAWAHSVAPLWTSYDYILFSFHGLPVSQIKKNPGCTLNNTCCSRADISGCYLAQCRKSVEFICEKLNIPQSHYTMTFQSRLGPTKWLQPDTEKTAVTLAEKGIKKLLVVCPAFVTDGLETLEEIKLELKDCFIQAGGQKFDLVVSLNDQPEWVEGFRKIISKPSQWTEIK